MRAGAIRGRGAIAAGRGIPAVRRPAERVQGTSVLADRTRSARQQQGKSNACALTTSGRERHQDNGTRGNGQRNGVNRAIDGDSVGAAG